MWVLTQLLIRLVNQVHQEIQMIVDQNESLIQRYNQRLFRCDQEIHVTYPDGSHRTGICKAISNEGGLIIETINGTEVIFSGTIAAV